MTGLFSRGLIIQFLLFAICMAMFSCTCQSVALAQFDDGEYTVDDGGTVAPSYDSGTSSTQKTSKLTLFQKIKRWLCFIVVMLILIFFGKPILWFANLCTGGRLVKGAGLKMEDIPDTRGVFSPTSFPPSTPAPEKPKENPDNDDSDKEKKDKEKK